MARALSEIKITEETAYDLTEDLVGDQYSEMGRERKSFSKILSLFYHEAKGSQLDGVKGTAWGYLNSITEFCDFHTKARSQDNRFISAMYGPGDALKAKTRELLLTMT